MPKVHITLPYFFILCYYIFGDTMYFWILRIVALIFLIWFIAPIFKKYFNHGNKLGIAICLYILLFYTNTPVFEYAKSYCMRFTILNVFWNTAAVLIYIFIAYAIIITTMIIATSLKKPKQNAIAITLGNRVTPDGPSDLLKGRIDATKRYLDKNKTAVAILSGGKCKRDFIEESVCMYNELIKDGVDENRLLVEDKSRSTYENILFSCRIIDKNQKEKNLAIVSDSFHQLRARLIVRKLGIKTHVGAVNAKTNVLYLPTYFVREWIALPYEVLFRVRPHRQ